MSDELKECNILKLILILRFAGATLDVGHPIFQNMEKKKRKQKRKRREENRNEENQIPKMKDD
jgi:hypothetical protein